MRKGAVVIAAAAAAAFAAVLSTQRASDGGATATSIDSVPVPAGADTATSLPPKPVRTPPAAGAPLASTLSGVYSEEQATRGADIYAGACISCHAGMGNHTGPVFRTFWAGYTLGDMFDYVYEFMPKNAPGSLTADEYVAVIAYLLKLNGMPAGPHPLPADSEALRQIRVDTATAKSPGTTDR